MAEAQGKGVGGDDFLNGEDRDDTFVVPASKRPLREMRIKLTLKRAVLGLLAVAATLPLWAVAEGNPAQRSRVVAQVSDVKLTPKLRIWDSKALVSVRHSGKGVSWINDDEIMFVGIRIIPDPSVAHTGEGVEYKLSIWNIRNGAVRILRDFGRRSIRPCFSDGHVLVWTRTKDGVHQSYYGDTNSIALAEAGKQFHGIFCRPVDQVPKLPAWTEGHEIRWLEKIDGGFLDFGDKGKILENTPIRFYRHGAKKDDEIVLSIGRRDVKTTFPYHAYVNAYAVETTHSVQPLAQGVPYILYWLRPNGQIERNGEIPYGEWRRGGSTWSIPTRAGILSISTNANVRNARDLAHAGLYLTNDRGFGKILTSFTTAAAVSPSGCRVAFNASDTIGEKQSVLKAIDLCVGG